MESYYPYQYMKKVIRKKIKYDIELSKFIIVEVEEWEKQSLVERTKNIHWPE